MRKIHLDNEIVEYDVGSTYIKFRFSDGASLVAKACDVKGVTPDTFERGRYKKSSDGQIKPSDIKKFLLGLKWSLMNNG